MKKVFVILIFNLSLLISNYSFGQWQYTNGPYNNFIHCLTSDGNSLYAGTEGGKAFLSNNNETSWSAVSNGLNSSTTVFSIAISGQKIYAATDNGIFLSTNNGSSWNTVNDTLNNYVIWSIAIKDTYIIAGTAINGIILSSDNGKNWKTMNNSLPSNSIGINTLTMIGQTIIAGTEGGGVFLSKDTCKNWIAMNTGLTKTDKDVWSFTIKGTNIYAGTDGGGVFVSKDTCKTWKAMNTGLSNKFVLSLANDGTYLYAGTNGKGVSLFKDSTWIEVNTGLTTKNIWSLAINGSYVFAGTDNGGVWKRLLSNITGINNLNIVRTEIKNYPNPTTGFITIETNNKKTDKYSLTIHNLEGQEVFRENVEFTNVFKLDLTNLKNGIYFLSLQNDKENYFSKVAIQK